MNLWRETATLIRTHGWTQGVLVNGRGEFCILGALISNPQSYYSVSLSPIFEEIGVLSLSTWNDTPGRTVEEVLAVLDRLAEREEMRADEST